MVSLDQPIGGSQRDHRGLVDRYRERGSAEKPGTSRASDPKAIDLSSLRRGTKRDMAKPDAVDGRDSDRGSKDAPRRALDGSRRKAAIDAQRESELKSDDHSRRVSEMRRDYATKKMVGLRRLADSKPSEYADVTRRGRRVATTSSVAVTVGLGFGTGLCTGSLPGWFWDPYRSNFECNPWTNWCNTWWWGTCGWFVPSCSWSFGFWCNQSSGWWSNNWCSPWWSPRYYACPVYYAPVIYDPSPTIIYQQPVIYQSAPAADVSAEAAPAQAGEGSIAVPQRPVPADGRSADNGVGGRTAVGYLDLGDSAWREGRYSDAVFFYAKAVEFAPDEGVYHLILADALFATGDYHYAAFSLRKALELEPGLLDSTLDKHSLYPNPADFDRQLTVLEQYVADHPIDDDARLLLAANYFFAKRPAQCADLFQSPFAVVLNETAVAKLLSSKAQELRATKGG